ncbi:MAG: hypothetical protein FWD28_00730 [Treponema sp.]|nr:hypothetical protein [Treponema sp.]
MIEEERTLPGRNIFSGGITLNKQALITIFVCVGISMFFLRAGFLTFFYLAPLGFAVIVSGSLWFTFFTAALTNIVIMAASMNWANTNVDESFSGYNLFIYLFYITTVFLAFIWLIGGKQLRALYRIIIASAAGAVVLIISFLGQEQFFINLFEEVSEMVLVNPEILPFLQDIISQGNFMDLFKAFLFRGGALISILFLFYINRHVSFVFLSLIKRQRLNRGLTAFFAPSNTVWVTAFALAAIFFTRSLKIEILEILVWNVFLVCALIFLAQGAGILTFWLSSRSTMFRIAIIILIVVIVLSPISIAVLAALLLLGVLESWFPFRTGKRIQ